MRAKHIRVGIYITLCMVVWIILNVTWKQCPTGNTDFTRRVTGLPDKEGKTGKGGEILKCANTDVNSESFPRIVSKRSTSNTPDGYWDLKWNNTLYDTTFAHKPLDVCTSAETTPDVVFLVFSSVKAVAARHVIRLTYGAYTSVNGWRISVVFALGKSAAKDENVRITREHSLYGDILQGNFLDSYQNMTVKNMVAFRWAANDCPNVTYVIRLSDDVMFSYGKLSKYLNRVEKHGVMFGPMIYYPRVFHTGKWKSISPMKWKQGTVWDSFIHGTFVVLSMDVVRNMFLLSCKVAPLWPDDNYLALLAEMLDIDANSRGIYEIDFWEVENIMKRIKHLNEKTYKMSLLHHFVRPRGPAVIHFGSTKMTPQYFFILWDLTSELSVPAQNTHRKRCETLCDLSRSHLRKYIGSLRNHI